MGTRDPEPLGIDSKSFFNSVLSHATKLLGVAEWQHGQDPDPDARLAVQGCLQAATLRMRSGLPFVPEPQQCIMLVEMASRAMARFAAAPQAASAAGVLLPPISDFLSCLADRNPLRSVRRATGARCSLLASVQAMLQGPLPLLSAAGVAAYGPALVIEAAASVFCAINIAALMSGDECMDESRLVVSLLEQCHALLADRGSAAKLQERLPYPQCSLAYEVLGFATQLARVADAATQLNITFLNIILKPEPARQYCIGNLADCQWQLLALSSAVAQPVRMHSSVVELPAFCERPSAYEGAALLAEIAKILATQISREPSSCSPQDW